MSVIVAVSTDVAAGKETAAGIAVAVRFLKFLSSGGAWSFSIIAIVDVSLDLRPSNLFSSKPWGTNRGR
jgi:hypothetical protein